MLMEFCKFQYVKEKGAHTLFGVVRIVPNLALPVGELAAKPTERANYDHTKR